MNERVNWFYHGKRCPASQQARRFLESRECTIVEEVDAAVDPLDVETALEIIGGLGKLVVAWRGEIRWWEIADGMYFKFNWYKPGRDLRPQGYVAPAGCALEPIVRSKLVSSSGSLRTPALRRGKCLLVGFSEAAAKRVFRA